jgi:cyclopropane fatty-acyl-phospholipid synthase-like methyltransferase
MTEPTRSPEGYTYKYDEQFAISQLQYYRENVDGQAQAHIESMVELIGTVKAKRILDLGCSIGTWARYYARQGHWTVGVDASPEVLGVARRLAHEEGIHRCGFVLADVSYQAFQNESFDLIIASDIFEHLPMHPLRQCIEECWRILVRGGRLIVHTTPTKYEHMFDYTRGYVPLLPLRFLPGPLLDRFIEAYDRFRYESLYKLTRGETRYDIYARSVHPNPLAYATLRRLLQNAGFLLDRYLVGNMPRDLQRPDFARASRLFPHAKNHYKHIWAVCRKPPGDVAAQATSPKEAWEATEIRPIRA